MEVATAAEGDGIRWIDQVAEHLSIRKDLMCNMNLGRRHDLVFVCMRVCGGRGSFGPPGCQNWAPALHHPRLAKKIQQHN
jgi:hypothetical protein